VGAVVGVVPEVVEVEVGAEADGDKQVLSIGFQVSRSSGLETGTRNDQMLDGGRNHAFQV